jgi:CRISPR/Cas system-associated exonuclease Cas4 (RecB family)
MSTAKRGTALPWSYSSLSAYETCPKRFYLTRISKLVSEKQTEATMHGNEVHKALEMYVGGKSQLAPKYEQYRPIADKLKKSSGEKVLEFKFGITKDLKPCTFFDKQVWARGVLDVGVIKPDTVLILDYKTGKRKIDSDQLKLFAGAALVQWPFAKKVRTGYIWLQSEQMDTEEFTQDDKVPIFQEFAARVHRMESSEKRDDWPANPSGLCKSWCPVGRKNCDHCGE